MSRIVRLFLRWHYLSSIFSLWESLLFLDGGPSFIFFFLYTEMQISNFWICINIWKSKYILIKICFLLFLHQFTESERNFLLETQSMTYGGTWRKYHLWMTWQPHGERLQPEWRWWQESENKIYRIDSHQWRHTWCNSVKNLARKHNYYRAERTKGHRLRF